MRNLLTILFLILLFSCLPRKIELNFPLTNKKYEGDMVTVQTAINIALQSYVLGCTQNKIVQSKNYESCLKLGKKYIEENVIFILDQTGEPVKK